MKHLLFIPIAVLCLNIGAFMALWKGQVAWTGLIVVGAIFLCLTFLVSKNPDEDAADDWDEDVIDGQARDHTREQ